MKENKIVNSISRFFENHGQEIGGILFSASMYCLARMLGVDIYPSVNNDRYISSSSNQSYFYARNPKETAIASILNSAKSAAWDATKKEYAKKITNIAMDGEASTKMFAINALNTISQTASWDSTKNDITGMIYSLSREDS